MTSKILINATHHHEVRVAIIAGQELIHYDYDSLENQHRKGSIYKGIVSRIEPSLNAAFIDYGAQRHGFLPASEVSSLLYPNNLKNHDRPTIQELLTKGQELIIQIDKDEIGNKGAALTTNISIAGCYIVLMPATAHAGGISRQIEGVDREHLMRLINQMDIPDNYSIIMRTASIGRSLEEILWDFNVLKSHWEAINLCAQESREPVLLYQEGAILSRVIRDYLKPSIDEILIDDKVVYEEVLKLVQHIRPDFLSVVKYFDNKKSTLFSFYGIEPLIESLFNSYVVLENGATLVIDHREALTSIDINSARSTSGGNIETTAFQTNLAAAKEIARQICLRNIGGQIVIDFIDMSSAEECRQVEEALKAALSSDKAKHQFCKISKLGLLQMSRQRLKTSLDAEQLTTCQNCHGHGKHRKTRSVALSILRLIEQECHDTKNTFFEVDIHPTIAEILFNDYRQDLWSIEKENNTVVRIKTIQHAPLGDYIINVYSQNKFLKKITNNPVAAKGQSELTTEHSSSHDKSVQAPQIMTLPSTPNPRGVSWLQKIWNLFGASGKKSAPEKPSQTQEGARPSRHKKRSSSNSLSQKEPRSDHKEELRHNNDSIKKAPVNSKKKQEPRVKKESLEETASQEPVKNLPAQKTHRALVKAPTEVPQKTAPSPAAENQHNNDFVVSTAETQATEKQPNRYNHVRRRRRRHHPKPDQSQSNQSHESQES